MMKLIKSVRGVILQARKVCVYTARRDGMIVEYNFPGGLVDPGETLEEAMIRETLEEVGLVIGRLQPMAVQSPNLEGNDAYYFRADYEREDKRLLGSEGDAYPYAWLDIDVAIARIQSGPASPFNKVKIAALHEIQQKPPFLKW